MKIYVTTASGSNRVIDIEQRPATKAELLSVFNQNDVNYSGMEFILVGQNVTLDLPEAQLPTSGDIAIMLSPAKIKGNAYDLDSLELPEGDPTSFNRDTVRSALAELRTWAADNGYSEVEEKLQGYRNLSADAMRELYIEVLAFIQPAPASHAVETVQASGELIQRIQSIEQRLKAVEDRLQEIAALKVDADLGDRVNRIEEELNLLPGAQPKFDRLVEAVKASIKKNRK